MVIKFLKILFALPKTIYLNFKLFFDDKVWIGNGCMIQKGAHVPNNCVIGARSVVTGSKFDNHTIIVGNPAKSVKRIGGFRI